jgi:hypothetical protein
MCSEYRSSGFPDGFWLLRKKAEENIYSNSVTSHLKPADSVSGVSNHGRIGVG